MVSVMLLCASAVDVLPAVNWNPLVWRSVGGRDPDSVPCGVQVTDQDQRLPVRAETTPAMVRHQFANRAPGIPEDRPYRDRALQCVPRGGENGMGATSALLSSPWLRCEHGQERICHRFRCLEKRCRW